MAEEENNNSKNNNLPGIKKSKFNRKSPKVINPTKKKALEELPSAPKYEFKPENYEFYSNTPNWLPQEGIKIEEVTTPSVAETPGDKPKEVKQPKVKEVAKKESKFNKIETKQQEKPSDMELAMMQANLEKAKQKQAEQDKLKQLEVPAGFKPTKEKAPDINMFEKINAMGIQSPAPESEEKIQIDTSELLMKIDKSEVRTAKDKSGQTVYIVDNDVCTNSEYREFMQQVAGKILALDCKKLEFKGVVYSKRGSGYVSSDGKEMSVDDMLTLINS